MKTLKVLSFRVVPKCAMAGQFAMKTAPPVPAKDWARILIADDSKVIRYRVIQQIGLETGLEVVGEAVNGKDAVTLARALRPDIVIMDVNMPIMDGIEATCLIMEEWPDTMVVGFSAADEQNIKAKMLKAGAIDHLDKCEPVSTLVPTLHRLWAAHSRSARFS